MDEGNLSEILRFGTAVQSTECDLKPFLSLSHYKYLGPLSFFFNRNFSTSDTFQLVLLDFGLYLIRVSENFLYSL